MMRPECPTCGEVVAPLFRPEDPDGMDGDGPRCYPCWRSLWAHGRANVAEAWLRGGEWPCQSEDDGRWYSVEDGCPGWESEAQAIAALTLPDPVLMVVAR